MNESAKDVIFLFKMVMDINTGEKFYHVKR